MAVKPEIAAQNKDVFSVTAGLGTLAAVLGAAGIAVGTAGKVISEEPLWFAISLIAVVVSAFLTFTAGSLKREPKRERQLLFGANVVLLAGLIAGLIGAVTVWSNTRAPMVTVAPEHTKSGAFLNV